MVFASLASHEIADVVGKLVAELDPAANDAVVGAVQRAAVEVGDRARRDLELLRPADQVAALATHLRNARHLVGSGGR